MPAMISKGMNLFLKADEPIVVRQNGPTLFINGFNGPGTGLLVGLDLFLQCVSGEGNVLDNHIPLFLQVGTSDASGRIPLFIAGENLTLSSGVNLVVWNEQTMLTSSANLFIEGSGTTDGMVPLSSTMNLFLRRDPSAVMTLFLQGEGEPISSGLTLFVEGSVGVSGLMTLVMPNTSADLNGTTTLYTHGY